MIAQLKWDENVPLFLQVLKQGPEGNMQNIFFQVSPFKLIFVLLIFVDLIQRLLERKIIRRIRNTSLCQVASKMTNGFFLALETLSNFILAHFKL